MSINSITLSSSRKNALVISSCLVTSAVLAGPYAPPAGQPGSEAIPANSPLFQAWAASVESLVRGPQDAGNATSPLASVGSGAAALGVPDGGIVSLGDGGSITLRFAQPIIDGPGFDLAVFENSFSDTFLELAFVEVSSNGTDFFRFPADYAPASAPPSQIGGFGSVDTTEYDNLAGKYRANFGTPFDLSELSVVSASLDVNNVTFVRIVDVVGSLNPAIGSLDAGGDLINDPYPTPFGSGGFDLESVGALNVIPEPSAAPVVFGLLVLVALRRSR
jgi:hypothetical protein